VRRKESKVDLEWVQASEVEEALCQQDPATISLTTRL